MFCKSLKIIKNLGHNVWENIKYTKVLYDLTILIINIISKYMCLENSSINLTTFILLWNSELVNINILMRINIFI